jgi:hypothetical protein
VSRRRREISHALMTESRLSCCTKGSSWPDEQRWNRSTVSGWLLSGQGEVLIKREFRHWSWRRAESKCTQHVRVSGADDGERGLGRALEKESSVCGTLAQCIVMVPTGADWSQGQSRNTMGAKVAGQRRRRRVPLGDLVYSWLASSTKRMAHKEGSATTVKRSGW